eukprot:scaffold8353_cov138-Cylindrotheca_fusiformis.AAC.44
MSGLSRTGLSLEEDLVCRFVLARLSAAVGIRSPISTQQALKQDSSFDAGDGLPGSLELHCYLPNNLQLANRTTCSAQYSLRPSALLLAILWFDTKKGFGFIVPDDGSEDVFVHQTSVHAEGFRSLAEGEPVEFSVVTDDSGRSKAENVTGPMGAFVQGAPRRPPFGGNDGGFGGNDFGGNRWDN